MSVRRADGSRRSRRAVALACALALGCVLTAAQSSEPPDRGTLAVLRRDGLIFPFANFRGDSWRVNWPVGMSFVELPPTLDSVPKRWWGEAQPTSWKAHLAGGATASIELLKPVPLQTFCSRRLWLASSYRSAMELPLRPIDPFPKDGLAIAGAVALEPIESVDPTSTEGKAFETALREHFDRVENDTIRGVRSQSDWRHPLEEKERQASPIRLESWYRSPSVPGATVSYVELSRAYAPGPEDKGCGLETLVTGWVHHENGEMKRPSALKGRVTYCDRVGATYMLPFGRIRPKEKTYWVFQLSGWDAEWYDVAEVGRDKVRHVVEVFAGGRTCQ